MRGQWNTENASVISADDAAEPTGTITAGNAPWGEFPTDSSNGRMIISYQGYDKSFALEIHSLYLIRPKVLYRHTCPRCLILAETGEKL
jgi:hypothetical protein